MQGGGNKSDYEHTVFKLGDLCFEQQRYRSLTQSQNGAPNENEAALSQDFRFAESFHGGEPKTKWTASQSDRAERSLSTEFSYVCNHMFASRPIPLPTFQPSCHSSDHQFPVTFRRTFKFVISVFKIAAMMVLFRCPFFPDQFVSNPMGINWLLF